MKSLDALKDLRNALQAYYTMENVPSIDEDLNIIEEDLEMLDIILGYMFLSPSFYRDQANWGNEYISMSYIEKPWTNPEIYEKVKEWCFKNKIRGTVNGR